MDVNKIQQLLIEVQAGQVSVEEALEQLRGLPYDDIGHSRLDMHRSLRQGLPEVVFCQNKTVEQVLDILARLWQHPRACRRKWLLLSRLNSLKLTMILLLAC